MITRKKTEFSEKKNNNNNTDSSRSSLEDLDINESQFMGSRFYTRIRDAFNVYRVISASE